MTSNDRKQPREGFAVELRECPHGMKAVVLSEPSGGYRLSSYKCCGQWRTLLDTWEITEGEADEMSKFARRVRAAARRKGLVTP